MDRLPKKVTRCLYYSIILLASQPYPLLAATPTTDSSTTWQHTTNTQLPDRLHSIDDDWHMDDPPFSVCRGSYLPPLFNDPTIGDTTHIYADKSELANQGTSVFRGNVLLQKSNERLYADNVKITRNASTHDVDNIYGYGHIFFEQPGARLEGSIFNYTGSDKQSVVINSHYRFYETHLRGSATKISHIKNKPYYLTRTTQTTCEPGDNFWLIKAKNITLDTEADQGTATHAFLYIKSVPVFYTPYLTFPISNKRKSGFLFPSFSYSKTDGFSYTQPYYFNLAPNYDATLTGRTIGKRGEQIAGEFRYLTPHMSGDFQADMLDHDRVYEKVRRDEKAKPSYPIQDPRTRSLFHGDTDARGSFHLHNTTSYDQHWSSTAEYHYVTDDNYLNDLNTSLVDSTTQQLNREFTVHYNTSHFQSFMTLQNFLTLQPLDAPIIGNQYRLMPRLQTLATYPDFYQNFSSSTQIQYTHFTHPDPWMREGERIWLAPSVDYLYQLPYFYARPRVEFNSVNYELAHNRWDEAAQFHHQNYNSTVPIYSFDTGLFFEREGAWFDRSYIQTMEPRLVYVYIPYKDQNEQPLFDTSFTPINAYTLMVPNRFSGIDRIGDTNRVGLSLTSRYIDDETGVERAEWQLAQLYYFQDRKVSLCRNDLSPTCVATENPQYQDHRSNIFFTSLYHVNTAWQATVNVEWDDKQNEVHSHSAVFNYRPDNDHIFNFGYNKTEDKSYVFNYYNNPQNDNYATTQTIASFAWRLAPRWNILGHWYYDVKNNLTLDTFGGIEYESCCWAFRWGGKRYLKLNDMRKKEFDTVYFFEFILKGLAGFGDSYSRIAESTIPGYTDRLGSVKLENLQTLENHR